jgi:hypothetical protein
VAPAAVEREAPVFKGKGGKEKRRKGSNAMRFIVDAPPWIPGKNPSLLFLPILPFQISILVFG